jgi:hypothetical protein
MMYYIIVPGFINLLWYSEIRPKATQQINIPSYGNNQPKGLIKMATRKAAKEAKIDANLEAKMPVVSDATAVAETPAKKGKAAKKVPIAAPDAAAEDFLPPEHPTIAKIKAERQTNPESSSKMQSPYEGQWVPTDVQIPCEIFDWVDYQFRYYKNDAGQVRPVLYFKKELFFSGWLCKDFDSARSLVIPIYYAHSGELKGREAALRPELLATHPLSALIYPDDNTKVIKESFQELGNQTDLFPITINPYGLALSGNTRLKVSQEEAHRTGLEIRVHCKITDGKNDVALIVGGNQQREKTPQDYLREAIAKEQARDPNNKYFWTNVRNTFIADSGMAGGIHDAIKSVTRFVEQRTGNPIAAKVNKIAEGNPTVALEIAKLQLATEAKDGTPLPEKEQAAAIGKELSKMVRQKSAKPIDTEKIYPGIQNDVATLREHYKGETVPAMADFLIQCTPEMRERVIAEVLRLKKAGETPEKLSILKARLEREAATPNDSNEETPDWNALNAQDEGATAPEAPAVDPNAGYYQKMRQMGISEDACWILNKPTAEALNGAVGGCADCDPFAEPTGHIECDRRILATERPERLEDWGGGVHASSAGLKIVTALPPAPDVIGPFTEMMSRIEDGRIAETAFIADASVVFLPRFAAYFKSIPLAWILVARENNKEATEGFGFEPSPFLHSHSRYKKLTEDNWNDSQRAYVIIYYGPNYDRFERNCAKYGNVCYNSKAAAKKSLHFDWQVEPSSKKPTAWNSGVKYEIDYIAGTYFLVVDGNRKTDRYTEPEQVKRAAVLESLNF